MNRKFIAVVVMAIVVYIIVVIATLAIVKKEEDSAIKFEKEMVEKILHASSLENDKIIENLRRNGGRLQGLSIAESEALARILEKVSKCE